MHIEGHSPLAELKRLERVEPDVNLARRLRIIILGIEGWTAPAVAMAVGLSRRICRRWVARYLPRYTRAFSNSAADWTSPGHNIAGSFQRLRAVELGLLNALARQPRLASSIATRLATFQNQSS